jgi:hypothetical protein
VGKCSTFDDLARRPRRVAIAFGTEGLFTTVVAAERVSSDWLIGT